MAESTPQHRATDEEAEALAASAKGRPRWPRRPRPSFAAFVWESVTSMFGGWPGRLWLMLGASVGVLVFSTNPNGFDDPLGAFVVGGFMVLLGWSMSVIPPEQSDGKVELAVASGLTMIFGGLVALVLRVIL